MPSIAAAMYMGFSVGARAMMAAPMPMPVEDMAKNGLRPYLSLMVAHTFVVRRVKKASVDKRELSFICPAPDTEASPDTRLLTRLGNAGIARAMLRK